MILRVRSPPAPLIGSCSSRRSVKPLSQNKRGGRREVRFLHDPLASACSSIGLGHRPLKPERRVRFSHGSLIDFGQVVEPGYTRRSERRAVTGMGVRLSPWSLGAGLTQFTLTQADQCPAGPHKPSSSGATPEPATCLQPSTQTSAKRSGREPDDFASSTLASATVATSWSNGDDA